MAKSSQTHANYFDDPAFGLFPAVNVNWDQAVAYCKSQQKSLPTEAQWEYAATGGDGRAYPWGNDFDPKLVPVAASDLMQVGSFPGGASPFGLNDMAGNALQWVADWYKADYYASSPANNPTGPASSPINAKVLRGGAYGNTDATTYLSAKRWKQPPTKFDVDIGFRCAMPAQ
jgi:formylglycine-generating enzyme required for sulfatase activity